MESGLTGSLKKTKNTDNLAVAEEANVDEAITAESMSRNDVEIYFTEELKTRAYKYTMNIDIENIDTFENRKKVYTTQ